LEFGARDPGIAGRRWALGHEPDQCRFAAWGLPFRVIAEILDSARFIALLKRLRRDAGGAIMAFVDNARHYNGAETRRFFEQQEGQIRWVYLLSYSSETNLNERVCGHGKRESGQCIRLL
jgi:hypothetical protein